MLLIAFFGVFYAIFYVLYAINLHFSGVFYAIKNGTEHIKKYNLCGMELKF
jgi:hypothetical protein